MQYTKTKEPSQLLGTVPDCVLLDSELSYMYSADSAVPSAVKLKMLLFSLVSAVSQTPLILTQRCPEHRSA